ncbi:uncharacterized protein LOC135432403 [Drosophila montana]|uniref:uncharacterized protein LOC135432403 n=1 Tax=Drosophila montana TaxID=40370 RepID=UPI00313E2E75
MELKNIYTCLSLLLSIIICNLSQCSAKPTYYDMDNYENTYEYSPRSDDSDSYALAYGKPLTRNSLNKLNTGYYYVDNGYIAPVSGSSASNRRRVGEDQSDQPAQSADTYRFTPLVRFRKTHTKRNKLFVPNLFG